MSYEIGEHKDGGYAYRIEVNGLITTGWRRGTRADVEKYAKHVDQFGSLRAAGTVPHRNADGSIRLNMSGKAKKAK